MPSQCRRQRGEPREPSGKTRPFLGKPASATEAATAETSTTTERVTHDEDELLDEEDVRESITQAHHVEADGR